MDIRKKPYEISLWDEQLIWHRRKLEKVTNTEEFTQNNPYKRGAYYIQSSALGATTYELSYDAYNENEEYFKLLPLYTKDKDGNEIKNFVESEVDKIDKPEDWEGIPQIVASFYKETRLCTIGSSSMESLARCVNPKLVSKVNGENILTFTMYYRYTDTQTGEQVYNPFISYLTNERKVKLKLDGVWYDFVIKQIQENSETKAFIYTCKDQFVNELSKTGFDIILDNELENNMGTVSQLAETILEGSDWALRDSDNLKQFVEEPLYEIVLNSNITAQVMETGAEIEIASGEKIYGFYSHVNDEISDFQFLYSADSNFIIDDDLVIDKDTYLNYIIKSTTFENELPVFAKSCVLTTKYRGMRLVRQVQTKYDATIDKFVQVYKKEGDDNTIYYGFTSSGYDSPTTVSNYVVNPSAFTSTTGWYTGKNASGSRGDLEIITDPPLTENSTNALFTSYLQFTSNGTKLMNTSIGGFKSTLGDLVENKTEYVLRIKYKTAEVDGSYATTAPKAKIGRYTVENDIYQFAKKDDGKDDILFDFSAFSTSREMANDVAKIIGNEEYYSKLEVITNFEEGVNYYEIKNNEYVQTEDLEVNPTKQYYTLHESKYIYMKATCARSVSKTELTDWDNRYGLFFDFEENNVVFIEEVQVFPYITYEDKMCVPGGDFFVQAKTIYNYYKPSKTYTSVDSVAYSDQSTNAPLSEYILQYNEGADAYTKVGSITAKESNRFNLLQDLNEKFECWSRFVVEHDEDGTILLGKDKGLLTGDEAYRQQKFVSFHEYAKPKDEYNWAGFKYGINSKSIQRTLDSNAIVSKMIVKDNANEFAPNGFCSIARASENPIKENFVLNFDHYIRQNLLNANVITNDLYLDSIGYLGYYKKLKRWNANRDAMIDKQSRLVTDISKYQASYQSYKLSYNSAVEERLNIENDMRKLVDAPSDATFEQTLEKGKQEKWEEQDKFESYKAKWAQCKNIETQHKPLYEKAERYLRSAEADYNKITADLEELANKKRALNLQFYKKYSRFIQEGSWIKEDYVDDNLYYLDSLSTLHTSAQPKVTYTINVLEISQLPGYEGYKFELGQQSFIEDPEFFGWSMKDNITPYREEIIISEITQELDSPEKNQIKVQNYKTQFEDLFQRITAQTQQAEYHTGEYKRAANVVESDGTISLTTLENSFANNALRLQNARDESVVIDEYGITSTSLTNPSEMVRIVAGGIFMSTDGGQSWRTGVTGHGLNSSYLTAGQINADEIYIMNGGQPAFRWDENGLSAYSHHMDDDNNRTGYNTKKYVRFDQFGIYGATGDEDEFVPKTTQDVHNGAQFALTWDGFSLKNEDGSVRISSGNDIQVLSKDENNKELARVKIGRLGKNGENWVYGIRISNAKGAPVMETSDKGELWLKNQLHVETSDEYTVGIGKLDTSESSQGSEHGGRVIDANNSFIVYEDGHVKASSGYFEGEVHASSGTFTGEINATGGKIGGLEIDSVIPGYEVRITASGGTSFKNGKGTNGEDTKTLTARVYRGSQEIENGPKYKLEYKWYYADVAAENGTSKELEVDWKNDGTAIQTYSCEVTITSQEVV